MRGGPRRRGDGRCKGNGREGEQPAVGVDKGHRQFRQQALDRFDEQVAVGARRAAYNMDGAVLAGMDGRRQSGFVIEIEGHFRAQRAGDVIQVLKHRGGLFRDQTFPAEC